MMTTVSASQATVKKPWYVNMWKNLPLDDNKSNAQKVLDHSFQFCVGFKNSTENNPTPQRNQPNRTQWKEEQEKNKKVWPSDALDQVLTMDQIRRRKSKYTVEKVTKSESEAGSGEGGSSQTTSRCEAKGTCGFYLERDVHIKAVEGYGKRESGMIICFCF